MTLRRYLLLVVTISLIGLWLRAPLLRTGFIVDDYAQLSMMAGTYPVPRSPLALFTFTNGSPQENRALKDAGFLPWWTHPQLKVSLFRPLASALMWLDRATIGDDAWLSHLHSAAWWLCMSITWGLLVRRFLPTGWALAVHALCTLHPAHGMLLRWIANRNASVAMFFGLLALLLQVRRREDGALASRIGQVIIPACWGLALLAGEYGASMLVFCFAYELTGRGPSSTRRSHIKQFIAVLSLYVLLRATFGFGSRESGMYIDPTAEPLEFLRAACGRGPVLVADLVLGLRADWWNGGYPWAVDIARALHLGDEWIIDLRRMRWLHIISGLIGVGMAVPLAWFAQRQNAKLRFVAIALPLSLIPTLGGAPEGRLLLPAMFGWSLLLAQTLRSLSTQTVDQRRATSLVAVIAVAALSSWEAKANFDYTRDDTLFLPRVGEATVTSILAPTLDQALAQVEDAFLIAAVDPTTTIYIPMLRRWHHHPGPQRCHLLLSTIATMRLDRLSGDEFRLSRDHGFYTPPDAYAEAFRREPLQVGQTFSMRTLRATVEQVHDGRAAVVRFKAARDLDDPRLALLRQDVSGLQVLRFPRIGESMAIAPPNFPFELLNSVEK